MTLQTMPLFKEAVKGFVKAIVATIEDLDSKYAQLLLEHYKLTPDGILKAFSETPK